MRRRTLLKTLLAVFAGPTVAKTSAAESSAPSINQTDLNQYTWEAVEETPKIPSFTDETHKENLEKTTWHLNAFYGTELPSKIEDATPLENVKHLKHIWTTRVTTTDERTRKIWTEGESAEVAANIDSTTEESFERYVEESILDGELEFRGEYHRKAVKQGTTGILGQLPSVGPLIAQLTSWVWDTKTSVTTNTNNTAHISQYLFSLPVAALSPNAKQKIDDETSLDYRGIYIDWFNEGDEFYAAGGIYPQNEEHLNERLSEAFDSGRFDLDLGFNPDIQISTDEDYEQEIIELLSQIQ